MLTRVSAFSGLECWVSGFSGMGIVEWWNSGMVEWWNGGMDACVIFWCMLAITASE